MKLYGPPVHCIAAPGAVYYISRGSSYIHLSRAGEAAPGRGGGGGGQGEDGCKRGQGEGGARAQHLDSRGDTPARGLL